MSACLRRVLAQALTLANNGRDGAWLARVIAPIGTIVEELRQLARLVVPRLVPKSRAVDHDSPGLPVASLAVL